LTVLVQRNAIHTRLSASTALGLAVIIAGAIALPGSAQAADSGNMVGTFIDSLGLLGSSGSYARGISADGSAIVGYSPVSSGWEHAYRWTPLGVVDLGTLGGLTSQAYGVSGDGTTVVGVSKISSGKEQGFRWTEGGGMQSIGTLAGGTESYATATNSNGAVVVGRSESGAPNNWHAIRWTSAGLEDLTTTSGSDFSGSFSGAYGVSGDGSIVVGVAERASGSSARSAFRWTAADGMKDLGYLPTGDDSFARAISSDGTTIVGEANAFNGGAFQSRAFRWTQGGGMQSLGTLTGGTASQAYAVNANGSVVVGTANLSDNSTRGFRWAEASGMQTVEDWLRGYGANIAQDMTRNATGVSADGNIVIGETQTGSMYIARVRDQSAPPSAAEPEPEPCGVSDTRHECQVESVIGSAKYLYSITYGVSGVKTTLVSWAKTVGEMFKYSSEVVASAVNILQNGAHGEPMRDLLAPGRQALSLTVDTGYDKSSGASGYLGLGDLGYSLGLEGGATVRLSIGGNVTRMDTGYDGSIFSEGAYVMPEITLPVAGNLYATLSGFYAHSDMSMNRAYEVNGNQIDYSRGETDINTLGAKFRLDWLDAFSVGESRFTPYGVVSYAHSTIGAFEETTGPFPAKVSEIVDHSTLARFGINGTQELTDSIRLLTKAEMSYRFEGETAGASTTVLDMVAVNVSGQDIKQFWLRGGLGAEFDTDIGKASIMANITSEGDDPSFWVRWGLRKEF